MFHLRVRKHGLLIFPGVRFLKNNSVRILNNSYYGKIFRNNLMRGFSMTSFIKKRQGVVGIGKEHESWKFDVEITKTLIEMYEDAVVETIIDRYDEVIIVYGANKKSVIKGIENEIETFRHYGYLLP